MIRVADDIVPIAQFKAHLSELVRAIGQRGRPVVVTQNGKPAAVVLSPEAFDRLSYDARFIAAVREGLDDAASGRVVSDDELGRLLDQRFGTLPRASRPAVGKLKRQP